MLKIGRQRVHIAASKLHKWLALVIGFQLILWFASGALMSFLSIDKVHGDHLVDRKAVAALPASQMTVDLGSVMRSETSPVEAITYRMLLGRPVAEVTTSGGVHLRDPVTGALSTLGAEQARSIAKAPWRGGPLPPATVNRITAATTEYRGALPAWRVEFADSETTRVFVTDVGRVAAVRTGTWRLYDFFWGLHIMDWKNHEDFNTPWLLAFAISGLALGLAGTVLLFMRSPIRRRRRAASTN